MCMVYIETSNHALRKQIHIKVAWLVKSPGYRSAVVLDKRNWPAILTKESVAWIDISECIKYAELYWQKTQRCVT